MKSLDAPVRPRLIGRDDDLVRVEASLRDARLVTVLGPAGIGKTRLAAEVVARARASGDLAGGVLVCDLAEATSADEAAAELGRALGCDVPDVDAVGHALALRGAALVALDDLERLAPQAAATIGRWLEEAGSARFLCTSREPLRLAGEVRVELEPLGLRDGVDLLVERAAALRPAWAQPDRDRLALEEIVRRLDGIPLALELAAARAPVLSPAALLERLSSRLAVLQAPSPGASRRQATLRAAIDWSWDLLDEAQREVLVQCAIFAGDFGLAAAEAVALPTVPGAPPVLDTLQALRERSLLRDAEEEVGEPRLGMLASVREYAGEKLDALGWRPAVAERHARHVLADGERRAEAARSSESAARIDFLSHAAADLHAAYRWLAAADPRGAARMALVLDRLLYLRGPFQRHRALLDDALRLIDGEGNAALRSRCLSARGHAHLVERRPGEAASDFEQALALARASSERGLEAEALRGLGVALRDLGRHPEAARRFSQATDAARMSGDLGLEAQVASSTGTLHRFRGEHEQALSHYQRALALHLERGDPRGEAIVRGNLGHAYAALGRSEEAEREIRAALPVLRAIGDRRSEAILTASLGAALVLRGYHADAGPLYRHALALSRELGDAPMVAVNRAVIAALSALDGHLAEAEQGFAQARVALERAAAGAWQPAIDLLEGVLDLARSRRARDADASARHMEMARDRLATAPPSPASAAAEHIAFAASWLTRLLDDRPLDPAPVAGSPGPILEVGPSGRWFRMSGGTRVDLARRRPLRRVLRVLVESRRSAPGQPVAPAAIASAVWPDQQLAPKAAASRIYVVVAELRKLGLEEAIARQSGGYLLHPAVALSQPAGD
jgi:predicted ATPase